MVKNGNLPQIEIESAREKETKKRLFAYYAEVSRINQALKKARRMEDRRS